MAVTNIVKFPYRRLQQIFEVLRAEPLPQDELARRLAVSARTVRNDMEILNEILVHHKARFVLKRHHGYVLQADNLSCFHPHGEGETVPAVSNSVPRNAAERQDYLMVEFLQAPLPVNLQSLSLRWFTSRATLQGDLAAVRERFSRYRLVIENRPRQGMQLAGAESAIRLCLTDSLRHFHRTHVQHPLFGLERFSADTLSAIRLKLGNCLQQTVIRLTDDGFEFLIFYCAVAAQRIQHGLMLEPIEAADMGHTVEHITAAVGQVLAREAGQPLDGSEKAFLQANIIGRAVAATLPDIVNAADAPALVDYILDYINTHYRYDLRADGQLHEDLTTHIKTMMTRLHYQINVANPVLDDIKQHYAMAYDITLSALSNWTRNLPYKISENEIGFLVLHIGVGLERNRHAGHGPHPRALLVCDSGNAALRNLEAVIARHFPQIEITASLTGQAYARLNHITEDFVIASGKIETKDKPVVIIPPFPSAYQLEQLARLVQIDRAGPYILEHYFSSAHFLIADKDMTRDTLFRRICDQLSSEGYVDGDFVHSVREREAMLGTLLGDGLATPHALGLFAKKTTIFTVLAPNGILWGDERAHIVFLIAASKAEYENIRAIYGLFMSLIHKRAISGLSQCKTFDSFKQTAMQVLREETR